MGKNTKKKPTADQIARELITSLYIHSDHQLILITKLKFKRISNYYGAVSKQGIEIYEFSQFSKKVNKVDHLKWADWNEVTIEKFFIKTIYILRNKSEIRELITEDTGSPLTNVLKQQTNLLINEIPRPWWRKILGFRSKVKWKMKSETVMKITYAKETMDKINWNNFLTDNVPVVANDYWEHPAISKE
jgi:hypothetical protein